MSAIIFIYRLDELLFLLQVRVCASGECSRPGVSYAMSTLTRCRFKTNHFSCFPPGVLTTYYRLLNLRVLETLLAPF